MNEPGAVADRAPRARSGSHTPDAELARAAGRGDRAALEVLLRRHEPLIGRVCARLCASPHDAQDATQEALIAIARGVARFDSRSAVTTWMYRVATNACLDELRRRRRRPEPAEVPDRPGPDGDDPAALAEHGDDRRRLAAALARLPEEYRVAVVLRDVADLDYAAIAEILDVAPGTVRSRIARGRGRLADDLARDPAVGRDGTTGDGNSPGRSDVRPPDRP